MQDPFETSYNVARTVTRDGLYTVRSSQGNFAVLILILAFMQIRGEFMRASRILSGKPDRALIALAQLCEERDEELVPASTQSYVTAAPRLPPIPPQVPYTVSSSQHAPPFIPAVDPRTPPRRLFEPRPDSG